jgi:hypothetical protein
MSSIIKPTPNVRQQMKMKGVEPKDHTKEYRQLLKSQSQNFKLNQSVANQPPKTPYKNPKFKNVESKAKDFSILPANIVRERLQTPRKIVTENKLPENPGGNKFFGRTPK